MTPPAAMRRTVRALHRPDALVLVDGRSGSGKSTFAAALAARTRAALLRMDDLYPGWDGLDAAADALARALTARRSGVAGALRAWDWPTDRPGERIVVPPSGRLVVEGCGALSRASCPLADLRVWVELPDDERRRRATAREADPFGPHWERWARQERRFVARESPRRLADAVVDPSLSGRARCAEYPGRP